MPCLRVVEDRRVAAFAADAPSAQVRPCVFAPLPPRKRTQFDPFQVKNGPGAPKPCAPPNAPPVTALQIAFHATCWSRMSNPFSLIPSHETLVALALVLAQVRIAPLTICVGVKRLIGGSPLSPRAGPCGPEGPQRCPPFDPCRPHRPLLAPAHLRGLAALAGQCHLSAPCGPVWLHEIAVSLGLQLSLAGSISRS